MVSRVDINNCKHFPELKTPLGLNVLRKQPSQHNFVDQSGNAVDLASTINIRNTFPREFASLVLVF